MDREFNFIVLLQSNLMFLRNQEWFVTISRILKDMDLNKCPNFYIYGQNWIEENHHKLPHLRFLRFIKISNNRPIVNRILQQLII